MTIKNTKSYKDYQKAKAAVEEVYQSRQKMTEALREHVDVVEKAKADLKKAKQEQAEAEDQAAIKGDMSLIEEAAAKVSLMEQGLENVMKTQESAQRVIDKADEKYMVLRRDARHLEKQYMLDYANMLKKEITESGVREKISLLIALLQRGSGHYDSQSLLKWFLELFPEHKDEEEYPALDEVLK